MFPVGSGGFEFRALRGAAHVHPAFKQLFPVHHGRRAFAVAYLGTESAHRFSVLLERIHELDLFEEILDMGIVNDTLVKINRPVPAKKKKAKKTSKAAAKSEKTAPKKTAPAKVNAKVKAVKKAAPAKKKAKPAAKKAKAK